MPEGRAPISSARIATGDIARHSFAVVRRGFDTDEVRAYLQSVARSLEAIEEREQELRTALSEAEERAAHPVVDEATLTASLGQHGAQILRHAHEEAARIVDSGTGAGVDVAAGDAESGRRAPGANGIVGRRPRRRGGAAGGQRTAGGPRRERADRRRRDGRRRGGHRWAKDEGRTLLEQVQEARRRVLADLASRRRALGIQIEQLRAARDEMAASVLGVRDKVDGILGHLERTDEEARAAATAVGDQFRLHGATEGPLDQDAPRRRCGARAAARTQGRTERAGTRGRAGD